MTHLYMYLYIGNNVGGGYLNNLQNHSILYVHTQEFLRPILLFFFFYSAIISG